ncbi:MAG: hypothetical protein EOO56_16175 [Hymenobacter sp.]|nr:MAG: hypothetical protein EOO56_16175 [Hymenobacter sp.]
MSTTQSLWGELPAVEAIRLPVVILREQAEKLNELTNGLLKGEVPTGKTHDGLRHHLLIVAPSLDNYSFSVLQVTHGIIVYPVFVYDTVGETNYRCDNEDEFIKVISEVLSSDSVHKIIKALLAQSKAEDNSLPF